MLKKEVLDGVAVGEVVEEEVDAEGEHQQCHRLLPLCSVVTLETQRWSLSWGCVDRRAAIFAF